MICFLIPDQQYNLIDAPGMEAVLGELREALRRWMVETADPLAEGVVPVVEGMKVTDADAFLADGQGKVSWG